MTADKKYDIVKFFQAALERGASDIIITAGVPPAVRLNGRLVHFDVPALTAEQTVKLLYSVLSQDQIARFERDWELDFSVQYKSEARFRGNAYRQKGAAAAVFRIIPSSIPTIEELGLPPVLAELSLQPQGLLLFTGPTGHGKSTTQAALLQLINRTRACHIITIEDPVEYLHSSDKSIIDQRDVGDDTQSFAAALKHVLRQDPDVIQVGELRDLESMTVAMTAAETGHLVMATLHTNSASQAIDRIIDVFPAHQQNQVRTQLSFCLLAVISQRLLPRAGRQGLVPAVEVLRNLPSVAHLIRHGKTEQIATIIETQGKAGMQSMDAALKDLYSRGLITRETALRHMVSPQGLGQERTTSNGGRVTGDE
ncbi:MAG: type IV pilus twitching motility protein PilT [Planctomycetota bacterium]|nr:type IV pilus twitching motility protein PilT [Planctomycetota bacterium]